jgi:hypothetical protein
MKTTFKTTIILALSAVAFGLGCASDSNFGSVDTGGSNGPGLNCETAKRVYATYLATMLARKVSEDEIQAAQTAGAFLSAWCGWTPPAKSRASKYVAQDSNGVPLLVEP